MTAITAITMLAAIKETAAAFSIVAIKVIFESTITLCFVIALILLLFTCICVFALIVPNIIHTSKCFTASAFTAVTCSMTQKGQELVVHYFMRFLLEAAAGRAFA